MSEATDRAMRVRSKTGSGFWGYQVYRRKFLLTLSTIIVLFTVVFYSCLYFFTIGWAGNQRQEAHDCFSGIEKKIGGIKEQLGEYVETMYVNRRIMMDAKVLFDSKTIEEYTAGRRENSKKTTTQIAYLPADMRRLFANSRIAVKGVTLSTGNGVKAIWLDPLSGDMHVRFGLRNEESAARIEGFGNLLLYSCSVRDPDTVSKKLGMISFWVDRSEVFEGTKLSAGDWGVFHDAKMLDADTVSGEAAALIEEAYHLANTQGTFKMEGFRDVYYTRMDSTQYQCSYVSVTDNWELWSANRKSIMILLIGLGAVALGALLVFYTGIQADSVFLSYIVRVLGAMETGDFSLTEDLGRKLPNRHNEYRGIALALGKVNRELKGYIQREYILKLKQQEAAMKALQQQINPHFLYNTLEMIRSRSLVMGDKITADAIQQLGSLFRARVRGADQITLKEEFALLELYLKIMQLRFSDHFVYQLELEPEAESLQTVNFWLQPLAENFFTHGFDRESEFNLLIVEGVCTESGVRIDITDNGTGMTKERLREVQRKMQEEGDDSGEDIGIRNVYMRLSYFYGEGFSMEISNAEEEGVHISIFICTKNS